jgi:hypothetical protein
MAATGAMMCIGTAVGTGALMRIGTAVATGVMMSIGLAGEIGEVARARVMTRPGLEFRRFPMAQSRLRCSVPF